VHVTVVPQAAGSGTTGEIATSNETAPANNATNVTIDTPKVTPTISATFSGDGQAYDPQSFSATLAAGNNPTGFIEFKVFEPLDSSCSGTPLYAQDATVTGNGTYTAPQPFTTGTGGTYHWTATYDGDAGNHPVATACRTNDLFIKAFPNIMLAAGTTSSTATLTNSLNATGTLTFNAYADGVCATPVATAAVPVSGNGSYTGAYTLPGPGNYIVTVGYSGDAGNVARPASGCANGGVVTIQDTGTNPPPPAPPPNHFTSPTARTSSRGTVTLSLTAPAAGRFTVTARSGRTTYGKASVTARAKGKVKLTLKPASAGRKLLKKHARLKLKITVTFTPTGGKPYTRTVSATINRR
jgi:hypothetical protein